MRHFLKTLPSKAHSKPDRLPQGSNLCHLLLNLNNTAADKEFQLPKRKCDNHIWLKNVKQSRHAQSTLFLALVTHHVSHDQAAHQNVGISL